MVDLPGLLRLALGLALALFLPGFALLAWLRPHRPALVAEWAERVFLSVVLSIALLVVVSVPLLYGPWRDAAGRGWFQGGASGAPVLEAILLGLTAAFAALAWRRRRADAPYPGWPPEVAAAHRRADALERGEGDEEEAARDLYG